MQYFGGKQRIAKRICERINLELCGRSHYYEPFVGGGSIISSINHGNRVGSDLNEALINMWKELSRGWQPPTSVSESLYNDVKNRNDVCDPLTAFCGFGCSFSGKWFGGYARDSSGRNYAANAASSLRKKMRGLSGVQWRHCSYTEISPEPNSLIYCDPPYIGTTQYSAVPSFDWGMFWDWCRKRVEEKCLVLVSEYTAPDDFSPCLTINTKTDIAVKSGGKGPRIEKLFTHTSTYKNGDWG